MERREYDQNSNGYNPYDSNGSYGGYNNNNSYNNSGYNSNESYNSNNYNDYNNNYNTNDNGYAAYGSNGGYDNNSYSSNYNNGGYDNNGYGSNYNNGGYDNNGYNSSYNNGGYDDVYDARYSAGASYYAKEQDRELIKSKIITRSFLVMLVSLLVTAFAATFVASDLSLFVSVVNSFEVFLVAEILIVIAAQFAINKRNAGIAGALYLAYSIINGVTLSVIFYAYEIGSVQ